MVAAENIDRAIGQAIQDGVPVMGRSKRWVHLEIGVISRPGRRFVLAATGSQDALAVRAPKLFTAATAESVRTK